METKNIVHMTKGDGEFGYAHNSNSQNRAFSFVLRPLIENAIKSILKPTDDTSSCKVLNVADLGCGVGLAPMSLISTVTRTVQKVCKEIKCEEDNVPEIQMYLSDLSSNDFNLLFSDVAKIYNGKFEENGMPPCFIMGAPGSFYGRLFPRKSMQLVVSYYAFHWLSQVPKGLYDAKGAPLNKGKILATETSSPEVIKSYYGQFEQDFTTFLKCRSQEVVTNGYMVLNTISRPSIKPFETRMFMLLYQALECLVTKGIIEEEKLDCFNMPMYFPCKEEINEIVLKEGSFAIEHLDLLYDDIQNDIGDAKSGAGSLSKVARSISESVISYHFGAQIWDDLYDVLYEIILKHLEADVDRSDIYNLVIVLRKKMD